MKITLSQFKGTAPKFHPEQLADNYAVTAANVRTGRGILEPWRKSSLLSAVASLSPVRAISFYLTKWFSWNQPTYMILAPIANDPWDYALIASAGTDPAVTYNAIAETGVGPYPATTHLLGVPRPNNVVSLLVSPADNWFTDNPTATPPTTGGVKPDRVLSPDEFDNSDTTYVLVYVDAWGRLSDLSDPSAIASIVEFDLVNTTKVTLTLPAPHPDLMLTDAVRGSTAKLRIYRANYAFNGQGVYQFVAEVSASDTTYVDSAHSSTLSEAPLSTGWSIPPNTDTSLYPNGPMEKLVLIGTDLIAGHNSKIVCFAEPQFYYAYPTEYYQVFTDGIVTIESLGSSLVVLTDRYPYVLQGEHPRAMSRTRLADPAPCASSLAVTTVADSVYFASSIGLFRVTGFTLTNVGQLFLTEREWIALDPSTMVFATYESKLFISCPSVNQTFVLDPSAPADGFMSIDFAPIAFHSMRRTNYLAYVDIGTSNVHSFDKGLQYRLVDWHSKTYAFNSPVSFNVLKVDARSYPITVTIHALKLDGNPYTFDSVVSSSDFKYLPVFGQSKKWSFSIKVIDPAALTEVRRIQVAHSADELS